MRIKIPSHVYSTGEDFAFKKAIKIYTDHLFDEESDGDEYYQTYSPAVKLVGKYLVNYRFGEDPYWVYEFECFKDVQINNIEVTK